MYSLSSIVRLLGTAGEHRHLPKKCLQVAQIFAKNSRTEMRADATTYVIQAYENGLTHFFRSIPAKFEHKLRRHKQTFGKIATTVVLDKDENGCNDIGAVIATKGSHYLLCSQKYFSVGTVLPKSITGAFSSNSRLDVREVKTESVRALSRYFGIKFLSLEIR